MKKPQDLRLPFAWEDRKALVHERLWYLPKRIDTSKATFPPLSDKIFFGNENPVHIEYCSGNGTWICDRAKANPHINFLAVEIRFDRARKIWTKLHNTQLNNLIIAWAEGFALTKQFIQSDTISSVYINFPDPWPKRRHAVNRIISPLFVSEMGRILKPNGTLIFVTDDVTYSEFTIKTVAGNPGFQNENPAPYFQEPPEGYGSSYFEELFRSKGKSIRYHNFTKV